MPFRVLAVLAAVTGLSCQLAGAVLGTVICGLVLGYLASLLVAPKRKCRSCGGSGEHRDLLGSGAVRRCWTCGGHKERARWGTRLLRPQVYARIRAGEHNRNW